MFIFKKNKIMSKKNIYIPLKIVPYIFVSIAAITIAATSNIIIYLNSSWKPKWGGNLGLWSNESEKKPGNLVKEIEPKFNRAVLFDTTQNSWHGLPNPLKCPKNQYRKSLAVYYLCDPPRKVSKRGKALFAPTPDQEGDKSILKLIKTRSNIKTASKVYN